MTENRGEHGGASDGRPGAGDQLDVGAIGVALSGGGVRAALFSLGVLKYLVQSGLNRRVTIVTSVSGGSITNAAIAASGDLSKMTIGDFDPVCGRLASHLAKRGSFFRQPLPRLVRDNLFRGTIYVVVVVVTTGATVAAGVRELTWLFAFELATVLVASTILFAAVVGDVFALGFRGPAQRFIYRELINFVKNGRQSWFGDHSVVLSDHLSPKDLADSAVTHVICATELLSGQPMFFSRDWVFSPTFGWGDASSVWIERAVYASAAFPGLFAPLRLRTKRLKMGGGDCNQDRPPVLLLADGGAYNNLGTDWFDLAERATSTPFGLDHRVKLPPNVVHVHQIVVNASSPSKVTKLSTRIPYARVSLA